MKIIKPSVQILTPATVLDYALQHIEMCGRVCYKSEDKITEGSAEKFVRGILKRGHEAVLEHFSVTLKFICDRGVSHEIVRHRLAAYCQESTRYCNYSKDKFENELTFIQPCFWEANTFPWEQWRASCAVSEETYLRLLSHYGATPQEARSVLPNSLKTEVVMTCDLREWRHFLALRCAPAAHPQMREVALMALELLHGAVPVVFDDLWEKYGNAENKS